MQIQIIERTKKDERKYNRQRRIEELKKQMMLLKAKLLKKGISPDDTRTLQAHADGQGDKRDYYISNPYLQKDSSYKCVNPIIEDESNNRYVYRGLVRGADNAIGVIESNVSISEIVASPSGNIKFQDMLSGENAMQVCKQYYRKIGESEERLTGHFSNFGKPDFVLGTILKGENGEFTFTDEIQSDIEQMLEEEREEIQRESTMREKDSVQIDLGGGLVVAQQDCWMEQGKKIRFAGINKDALLYAYEPDKTIKTDDGKYVYVGTTQIGRRNVVKKNPNEPIQFVKPFIYEDVVFWTDNKNLIQYFLDYKFQNLNFALGETFSNGTIKNSQKDDLPLFIGGISLDEQGECISIQEIPDSVEKAVQEYLKDRTEQKSHIINFEDYQV